MSSSNKSLRFLFNTFLLSSSVTTFTYMQGQTENKKQYPFIRPFLLQQRASECWISDEKRRRLQQQKIKTNVYVWGEGQQVDIAQDYSNYTPKKLKPFRGKDKPNIIDVAFGWYHEAYIDLEGKLYVCKKFKLPSIKVDEIDEKDREDLVEVKTLPKGTKVKQVSFTRQRMFVLSEKGDVYVYKITEHIPTQLDVIDPFRKREDIKGDLHLDSPAHVKDLKNIKMIACGSDHFLALAYDGLVYAMGDDTFGQCGQTSEGRQSTAPFFEKRFGKPQLVQIPEKVVKIVSGYRHNFAITDKGNLYGWGYNNQQQLSHADEYAQEENPWHAIFTPMLIKRELEGKFVVDAGAGEEFSVILCKNLSNNGVYEAYSFGNNLRGQLGINRVSHLQDQTLIEDISGFVDMQDKGRPLRINNIQCGRRHTITTFDYGAFFIWGDNEFGQLGDKKRRFLESPYPKSKFEQHHNVENVVCGQDSCAVIVEDLGDENIQKKKKKKKKQKRTIKKSEMITSVDQLKAIGEAKMQQLKKESEANQVKPSLTDQIRSKWLNVAFKGEQKTENKVQQENQDKTQDKEATTQQQSPPKQSQS